MMDRPENFRYGLGRGTVQKVYRATWEVDILAEEGGIIRRARVVGPRRPEVSTPARPQWVVFGFVGHNQSHPICLPEESRLSAARFLRDDYLFYYEFGELPNAWRFTVNEERQLEILHLAKKYHLVLQEKDGVLMLETPKTRLVLKDADGSILLECDQRLTVHCQDATVNVDGSADVTVGQTATVKAGASVDVEAPAISLKGAVAIEGNVAVTGNVNATGTVIDATGNTPHHSHG